MKLRAKPNLLIKRQLKTFILITLPLVLLALIGLLMGEINTRSI